MLETMGLGQIKKSRDKHIIWRGAGFYEWVSQKYSEIFKGGTSESPTLIVHNPVIASEGKRKRGSMSMVIIWAESSTNAKQSIAESSQQPGLYIRNHLLTNFTNHIWLASFRFQGSHTGKKHF